MAKNSKMKECMSSHSMMHGLFGLGLGIFIAAVIPSLSMWWLGVLLVIIAFVWDWSRKS